MPALFLAAAIAFAYAVWESSIPFLWITLAAAIFLSFAAVIAKTPTVRALWVNLVVACCVIGSVEFYFLAQGTSERRMEYSQETFFITDELLGYKPAAGTSVVHRTSTRTGPLYDATYTIDAQGLRIASPPMTIGPSRPCILFFGDSFTFGEGVNDEDTMPYQVWKHLHGAYRTVNFGFLGYGPHQMLAAIEHGHIESRARCQPSHVIYQTIPAHPSRSAGLEFWDLHGPRYVMDGSGKVHYAGRFDDMAADATLLDRWRRAHERLSARLRARLEGSALYRVLLHSHRHVDAGDIALYGAIVGGTKDLIEARYPGADFHVLLWDYENTRKDVDQILPMLASQHVDVILMSTILPHFPEDRGRYEIHPDDRHPNALAHALIADYVVKYLIHPQPERTTVAPQTVRTHLNAHVPPITSSYSND